MLVTVQVMPPDCGRFIQLANDVRCTRWTCLRHGPAASTSGSGHTCIRAQLVGSAALAAQRSARIALPAPAALVCRLWAGCGHRLLRSWAIGQPGLAETVNSVSLHGWMHSAGWHGLHAEAAVPRQCTSTASCLSAAPATRALPCRPWVPRGAQPAPSSASERTCRPRWPQRGTLCVAPCQRCAGRWQQAWMHPVRARYLLHQSADTEHGLPVLTAEGPFVSGIMADIKSAPTLYPALGISWATARVPQPLATAERCVRPAADGDTSVDFSLCSIVRGCQICEQG